MIREDIAGLHVCCSACGAHLADIECHENALAYQPIGIDGVHYCRDCERERRDTIPAPPPTTRDREERCDTET